MKKSLLALSVALASLGMSAAAHTAGVVSSGTTAGTVAAQPPYQALPFQLTKPVEVADVKLAPVGDFEAYVEVPGKGGCTLTGQAKVIGMEPQGGGVRFDLAHGGMLKCGSDAPREVAANLVEEGDGVSWLPPQVNLCTRWDGTDIAKHPKCLQRSVTAYWLDTGIVRIIGL